MVTEWYWWVGTIVVAFLGFILGIARDSRKENKADYNKIEETVVALDKRVAIIEQLLLRMDVVEDDIKTTKDAIVGIQLTLATMGRLPGDNS